MSNVFFREVETCGIYTQQKEDYSIDINHCLQCFTKAATLLQPTKFLKTEIIKKYSLWDTARQPKCLEFRVCRIAMDFYLPSCQRFSASFITLLTQLRTTWINKTNMLIICGTNRDCTFRKKILLRLCDLDCVFSIWSGALQGGTKRKCIMNDVLKISWNVLSDGENWFICDSVWSDTTCRKPF